ncbi:MAG TPA: asparagine synthase-related protein, partial [Nitrococcus sp.]|nr:asparagine synthase-related protein [Nitrococcus sp.]
LRRIDGVFAAVIYDARRRRVHLVTDRHGLRPLYWTVHHGQLAWASEVKAFLALPTFRPKINVGLTDAFFEGGFLIGDGTWFEGAELLPYAAVLTWELATRQPRIERYWSFDSVKPIAEPIDEQALAEELGARFIESVRRRWDACEDVGITLSGGLDSRAILAAAPNHGPPIPTFTFGVAGCTDLRIARRAARVKGARHQFFELSEANWLAPRIEGIWLSDGMLNLLHMHGLERFHYTREPAINLNGFLGDALLGGSYIGFRNWPVEKTFQNRGRRFILIGLQPGQAFIHQRMPFFANDLLDLTLAIPESVRQHSHIYNKMLLQCFPTYYRRISWQKTRVPIGCPCYRAAMLLAVKRLWNRLGIEARRFGLPYRDPNRFHDYPQWIRRQPARAFFTNLLRDRNALYPEYVSRTRVLDTLQAHMAGADHSELLCRYLTFELFLQQTFKRRYRQSSEWISGGEASHDPSS